MAWTSIPAASIVHGDALLLTMLDDEDNPSLITARCLSVGDAGIEIELISVARGPAQIRPHVISVFSVEDVAEWSPCYRPEASPTDRSGADVGFMLRELERVLPGQRRLDLFHTVDPATGQPLRVRGAAQVWRGVDPVREWMLRAKPAPVLYGPRPRLGEYERIRPERTTTRRPGSGDAQIDIILAAYPNAIVRECRIRGRGGRPGARAATQRPEPDIAIDGPEPEMEDLDEPIAAIED